MKMHNGSEFKEIVGLYIHDGTQFRTITKAWIHDGSEFREVYTGYSGPEVTCGTPSVLQYGTELLGACQDAHQNRIPYTLSGALGSYTITILRSVDGDTYQTIKTEHTGSLRYDENNADGSEQWGIVTSAGTGFTFQYKVQITDGSTVFRECTTSVLEVASSGGCFL